MTGPSGEALNARARHALGGVALLVVACKGRPPLGDAASSTAVPAASAASRPSTIAQSPSGGVGLLGEPPRELPLELGPTANEAEREARLKQLVSGQTPAERLPLVDTEANVAYDSELYATLTTEVDTRPRPKVQLRVSPATLLSGALDKSVVDRVLGALRGNFRACYQRGLDEHEDAPRSAKLTLVLQVATAGDVVDAKVAGKRDPRLTSAYDCMRARASRVSFEPAPGKLSSLSAVIDITSQ